MLVRSIPPVAHQLPVLVVERPQIGRAVIPDAARRPAKDLCLSWRKDAAGWVALVAQNTAHRPVGEVDRVVGRDVPQGHGLGLLVDIDDPYRIVRRGSGVRVGLTIVQGRRREDRRGTWLWQWRDRGGWCIGRGVVAAVRSIPSSRRGPLVTPRNGDAARSIRVMAAAMVMFLRARIELLMGTRTRMSYMYRG
jgi:hypothetical protein